MHKENKQISIEIIYYHIPDQYINIIRKNNINIIIDHGHYYCIITMRQLYQLIPNTHIFLKYTCEKCNKQINILGRNITRKLNNYNGHLYCQKCSMHMAFYKYSTDIPISKQQKYFYDLFINIAKLNYQVDKLFIDIAMPQLNIGIEYNGGGHDLSKRLNAMTHKQFINKEWRRRYILQNKNWKMIYIIASHDKINNYSAEEYIQIFNHAYLLLQNEDIVEIYIEDNRILTQTQIVYISDILSHNKKNIRIYTIHQAMKYLNISRKTLYQLHKNKLLLMNSTPYSFKYYIQDQLDEYISHNNKLNKNNFFLKEEAAKYVNVKPYKFDILRMTGELFPQIINQDEYYSKQQLDKCIANKIFDKYLSTTDALNYLNKALNINKQTIPYKLIPIYIINRLNFYTTNQLDKYITNKLYLNTFYTRSEAADYLHLSLATLDRLKQQNLLIPIEDGALYSKKQLDQYLINNNRNINFNDYITIHEATKLYPITYKQLWLLINNNKVSSKRINNMHYILKQDIINYLNRIEPGYITYQEAIKLFKLTKSTIEYLRSSNLVKTIRLDTNYVYCKDDIINYLYKKIIISV